MLSRKDPHLELLDTAVLVMPDGKHPLKMTDDSSGVHVGKPDLDVNGKTEAFYFTLVLFSPSPKLILAPRPATRSVTFETQDCFYQRDGGEKLALRVEALKRVDDFGEARDAMLSLDLPLPLSNITLTSYKASPQAIETIEAMRGEAHRIYIPFRVDGEHSAIDASFELKIKRSWHLSASASMP